MITRKTWLLWHRILALGVGFLFALLGLTGSLAVYREELDGMLNPELVIERPSGEYLSLDRIMDSVQKAQPRRPGSWMLEMPRSPHGMVTAWYDQPHETVGEFYAPLMVLVNPYTAEVVASRFWGRTAATWLLELHTQLRFDRGGWNAVGILGLLLIISAGSGLYLWWPGKERLAGAFAVRRDAGMSRLSFGLHRLVGLCAAPVLLLLAFTGFHLSYPEVLETLAGATGMDHGNAGPAIRSRAVPNNYPVGLEDAVFIARSAFPRAELRRVTTPDGDKGVYRVNFRLASEPNRRHPYAMVWVDRWSGHILDMRNPAGFSAGKTFAAWMWPAHTGEAFGPAGRLMWFLAGQALFLLYVSGLLYWLHRRGSLRDREVDFAALGGYVFRKLAGAWRIVWKTLLIVARLILKTSRLVSSYLADATSAAWFQRTVTWGKDRCQRGLAYATGWRRKP